MSSFESDVVADFLKRNRDDDRVGTSLADALEELIAGEGLPTADEIVAMLARSAGGFVE